MRPASSTVPVATWRGGPVNCILRDTGDACVHPCPEFGCSIRKLRNQAGTSCKLAAERAGEPECEEQGASGLASVVDWGRLAVLQHSGRVGSSLASDPAEQARAGRTATRPPRWLRQCSPQSAPGHPGRDPLRRPARSTPSGPPSAPAPASAAAIAGGAACGPTSLPGPPADARPGGHLTAPRPHPPPPLATSRPQPACLRQPE